MYHRCGASEREAEWRGNTHSSQEVAGSQQCASIFGFWRTLRAFQMLAPSTNWERTLVIPEKHQMPASSAISWAFSTTEAKGKFLVHASPGWFHLMFTNPASRTQTLLWNSQKLLDGEVKSQQLFDFLHLCKATLRCQHVNWLYIGDAFWFILSFYKNPKKSVEIKIKIKACSQL